MVALSYEADIDGIALALPTVVERGAVMRHRGKMDWIGLGVQLGGIVALFAAAAAFTMLMLSSGPKADTARSPRDHTTHQIQVDDRARVPMHRAMWS